MSFEAMQMLPQKGLHSRNERTYTADELARQNRQLRVYGGNRGRGLARDMLVGQTLLKLGHDDMTGEDGKARTVYENGLKSIYMNDIAQSGDFNQGLRDIITLSHEAWRDGVDNGTYGQRLETRNAVRGHIKTFERIAAVYGEGFMKANMDLMQDYAYYQMYGDAYVDEAYDSSKDYWKLNKEGELEYDGRANLYDEDGKLVRATESQGIEGSLIELLGIEDTTENRHLVISMMISSGMTHSYGTDPRDKTQWMWNKGIHNANNMGKSISLDTINTLFDQTGAGKATVKSFIDKNYFSAIGMIEKAGNYSSAVNDLLGKVYDPSEIKKVKVNNNWLQNAKKNGIDVSKLVPGLEPTNTFENDTGDLKLLTSSKPGAKFFWEIHTGIDYGEGGESVNTPGGIWQIAKKDDHRLIMQLFGSDLRMRAMHLNPDLIDEMTIGSFLGEGNESVKILDYPAKSYGTGTGPHTHFDFTGMGLYDNSYQRRFFDYNTVMPGGYMYYPYAYKDVNRNYLSGYPKNFYIY